MEGKALAALPMSAIRLRGFLTYNSAGRAVVAPMTSLLSKTASVLTIDDDRLVRESISVYLEDSGYTILEADNGLEGLRLFREQAPDIVVCDLRMPDMDGLDVLKVLTRESPNTPVIVLSGAGVMHDVVEALRLGATDYLFKPIADLAVLEHAIRSAWHRIYLEHQNARYREELEQANRELESHLSILRADQEAGRRAQIQLLPEPEAQFGEYRFSHTILPSLYLSGDFLDYFEIDERYLGFYIADVSGHGSASAFVTMMLKSLMNQPLRQYRCQGERQILEPARLLTWLNSEVLNAKLGKYFTLFYAVIDRATDTLHFANGGHFPRPVAMGSGRTCLLEAEGFPIGLFPWASYEEHKLEIPKTFTLGLFSDGLLELLTETGLEDKQMSLLKLCAEPDISVDRLRSQLRLTGLHAPSDDITLFLVQRF